MIQVITTLTSEFSMGGALSDFERHADEVRG